MHMAGVILVLLTSSWALRVLFKRPLGVAGVLKLPMSLDADSRVSMKDVVRLSELTGNIPQNSTLEAARLDSEFQQPVKFAIF